MKAQIEFGLYESAEVRFVRKYLAGVKNVVDLGASLGVVSTHALSVMHPRGHLVAIEANPALIPRLESELTRVADGRRVTVLHGTVAPKRNRFKQGNSTLTGQSGSDGIPVPSIDLNDVVARFGQESYSLICDIEGAEHELLHKDAAWLSRCYRVVIELHDNANSGSTLESGLATLEASGLRTVDVRGPVVFLARSSHGLNSSV